MSTAPVRAGPSAPVPSSSSLSSTSTMATDDRQTKSPKLEGGIAVSRLRSLEAPLSLAAPLSRILSTRPISESPVPNPYPGAGTEDEPYLVDWIPGEQANPYNWTSSYRWMVTAIIAVATLCIAFASSSYSAAITSLHEVFGISTEVGILGITFYICGFGLGPLCFWAPLSEIYGRRLSFNVSFPLFVLFNMAGALAQNVETIMISRFLSGLFGSAPLTNAGGQISDMWAAHERALATSMFALAPFLGPVLGPLVGGFVSENAGFRWVFWVQFIFGAVMLVLSVLLVPETYAPTLLRRKAAQLQKEADEAGTGEYFISKYDRVKKTRAEVIKQGLSRPFLLVVRELIVFCFALYAALIYGILYLFFEAFPIVFEENRGWTLGESGLAFLGIGVGLIIGIVINSFGGRFYTAAVKKAAETGTKVPPEARLPMCCVGAVLCPVGLFWFAWTSTPNIHWIVPIIASVPFGTGFLLIFTGMTVYMIDAYTLYAASALAANAVMRSIFGAVFPLFATYMYVNLGLQWAGTILAFLSLACLPIPFLFYKYGHILRRNSKYAPSGVPVKAVSVTVPANTAGGFKTTEVINVPIPEDEALEPEYAADAGENAREDEQEKVNDSMV